ncbi:MAG: methyltransferase domain-containing protein [Proteobacteria bacterium]|nr:methyltransferase domain-containing protein [Pseudomonadota bacterium]
MLDRIRSETRQGNYREAIILAKHWLARHPNDDDGFMMLGIIAALTQDPAAARVFFHRSVTANPENGKAWDNLGRFLCSLGEIKSGVAALLRAHVLGAIEPEGFLFLARGLHLLRRRIDMTRRAVRAVDLYARAFSLNSRLKKAHWPSYVDVLKSSLDAVAAPWMIADLRRACVDGSARPSDLMPVVCKNLTEQGVVDSIISLGRVGEGVILPSVRSSRPRPQSPPLGKVGDGRLVELCRSLSGNALLLTALASAPMAERSWEAALTGLRRRLLDHALASADAFADAAMTPVIIALALQCALNESIFFETEAEANGVDRLARHLARLDTLPASGEGLLAVAALYRADTFRQLLASHPIAAPSPAMQMLIDRLVREPEAEAALAAAIPRLGQIDDAVSKSVRRQYEESPYPRWITTQTLWPNTDSRATLGMLVPALEGRPPTLRYESVLIAGCGTGRQLIETACLFPKARVVGIDLSLKSLGYAKRKAIEAGIANIELMQADLLDLKGSGKRFDIIMCSGVLHHMAAPLKGLSILRTLMKPSGLIYIGLYSRIAREHLLPIQTYIKQNGLASTPDAIRSLRHLIRSQAFPDFIEPGEHSDFYTLSECRDLLFHAHEDTFDLDEIAAAIRDNRLRFLGFTLYGTHWAQKFTQEFPNDPMMLSLDNWRRFESKHRRCFAGMYQFWAMAEERAR